MIKKLSQERTAELICLAGKKLKGDNYPDCCLFGDNIPKKIKEYYSFGGRIFEVRQALKKEILPHHRNANKAKVECEIIKKSISYIEIDL